MANLNCTFKKFLENYLLQSCGVRKAEAGKEALGIKYTTP